MLSPWRRRSTEESKRVHDAPILAVPGMARRQDHGRLYNRYCTRGWLFVATSRCSLRPPPCRGQPGTYRMERRDPGPGRIIRSRSRRDLRMAMCRSVPAVALRAPFGPLLEPFWDLQKMRWAEELRYWDPEHYWLHTSGQQRVKTNTRYHLKFPR